MFALHPKTFIGNHETRQRFNATPECELLMKHRFKTKREAALAILGGHIKLYQAWPFQSLKV